MTSPNFATVAPRTSSTTLERCDALVEALAEHKDRWVRTTTERRIQLLEACIARTVAVSEDWVRKACQAKGVDFHGPRAGEEWLGGPMVVVRNLRMLAEALREGGEPRVNEMTEKHGRWVADIFPASLLEKLMYRGFSAQVWIQPGHEPTQGRIYREKAAGRLGAGKVALVLGAGNVSSIGPMDALYKLFVEDEVVLLKTNPVNEYLQPYWEEAFRPLIDEGVYAIVRGGAAVGAHLVQHPKVDTIHMTGSDRTFDAIVWGSTPEEQARRKASGERVTDKPISAELGAVTPVLVVPGPWTDEDLDFQARNVTAMVANNASFNCNAAKVLVTSARWPLRERFVARVAHHLADAAPRHAYYPGAQERYDAFLAAYPQAEPLGPRSTGVVPWTLIRDVPPRAGEHALTNEAFCGVLAETKLDSADPGAFIDDMVRFANDSVWGTLSCVILIHPATRAAYAEKFERALAELRYGGIAVNCFAGVIYALVGPSWGAYPGHPDEDIRSGRGVVHNAFLFDHPEKSVVEAPFHIDPTPAWFVDHKTAHDLGRALVPLEANPSLVRLPMVLPHALRG
ncbi:MAG: aldehyde dehydrogenase family protein [Sandaracinaceae bacterium]|nr:aldehyde dehydrogenase family protein [Sandaracinaceae bacterium]